MPQTEGGTPKEKATIPIRDTDAAPKVSVIIPVYNTEKYVQQTLESICRQTLHEIEIITINDGSTDGSAEILRQAARKDGRIQIYKQSNQGLSIARNTGIGHARGKYIYLMDSDDLLEENTLELCYKKCETENLDFVFFDAENFYEDRLKNPPSLQYSHTQGLADKVYEGRDIFDRQVEKHIYTPSACLNFIRRSFLDEYALRFFPHILHEDQLFTALLYLQARRVGLIRHAFFHRRIRPYSIMTSRFAWINMTSYLTVTDELLRFAGKQDGHTQEIIHRFLSQMFDAAVWQAHVLPLHHRIKLLYLCLTKYRKYVSPRTLGVLMLKGRRN